MRCLKLTRIAVLLSKHFKVSTPYIEFWDSIPEWFSRGISSASLEKGGNGLYIPGGRGAIVLELFHPKVQKRYSEEAVIHCFAHEFTHHLESVRDEEYVSHGGKFAATVRSIKRLIREIDYE